VPRSIERIKLYGPCEVSRVFEQFFTVDQWRLMDSADVILDSGVRSPPRLNADILTH
jgi:hypothetical protein